MIRVSLKKFEARIHSGIDIGVRRQIVAALPMRTLNIFLIA